MTSTYPKPRKKTPEEPKTLKEIWFNYELNNQEHKLRRALRDDPKNAMLKARLDQVHRLQKCIETQGNVIVQVFVPKNKPFDSVAYIDKFYATHPPKQLKPKKSLWDLLIGKIR